MITLLCLVPLLTCSGDSETHSNPTQPIQTTATAKEMQLGPPPALPNYEKLADSLRYKVLRDEWNDLIVALRDEPPSPVRSYFLAWSHRKLEDYTGGEVHWRDVKQQIPELADLAAYFIMLPAAGRDDLETMDEAFQTFDGYTESMFFDDAVKLYVREFLSAGRAEELIDELTGLLRRVTQGPASAAIESLMHLSMASTQLAQGNLELSWHAVARAIEADPEAHRADLRNLANSLSAAGSQPDATRVPIAKLLVSYNELSRARRMLEELPANALSPAQATEATALLGDIYLKLDQFSDAVASFERVLAAAESSVETKQSCELGRALALRALGRTEEAWPILRRIAADDGHLGRKDALESLLAQARRSDDAAAEVDAYLGLMHVDETEALFEAFFEHLNKGRYDHLLQFYPPLCDAERSRRDATRVCFWLARISDHLNRPEDASRYYQKAFNNFQHDYHNMTSFAILESNPRRYNVNIPALLSNYRRQKAVRFEEPGVAERIASQAADGKWRYIEDKRLAGAITLFQLGHSQLADLMLRRLTDERREEFVPHNVSLSRWFKANGYYQQAIRYAARWVFYINDGAYRYSRYIPDDMFEDYLPRHFADDIRTQSSRQEVDPYVIHALIREESRYNPEAKSWAAAEGLMQLMPATGRAVANLERLNSFEPFNFSHNIRLGTRYFADLDQQFNSYRLSLASYNGGQGRMRQRLRDYPREFAVMENEYHMSELIKIEETREYVKRVMGIYYSYRFAYENGNVYNGSSRP